MKIYFLETSNLVIAAEGRYAKIQDAAPTGIFEGVDLYAKDAAEQLKRFFSGLDESGDLNSFDELGWEELETGHDLFEELVEADLVFSDGDGIRIWSVENSEDPADDVFCGTWEECQDFCENNGYILGEGWQLALIAVDDNFCQSMTLEIAEVE